MNRSRDSSVGTATGQPGSIPGRDKSFLYPPRRPDRLWGSRDSFQQEQSCSGEADHSRSSSAEVKNGEAVPPLPRTLTWCGP
jgi:hypothetical protein